MWSQEAEHGQAGIMLTEFEEHRLRAYNLWQQVRWDGQHEWHWSLADKDALAQFDYESPELHSEKEREQIEKRLADTFADLDFIPVPEILYRVEDGSGTGNPRREPIISFVPAAPSQKSAKVSLQSVRLDPTFVVVDLTTERTQTMLAEGAGLDYNPFADPEANSIVIKDIFQLYKKALMTLGVLGFARYHEDGSVAKKPVDPKNPHNFANDLLEVEPNAYDLLREFVTVNPTMGGCAWPVVPKKKTRKA